MKICITGICGFVGCSLAQHLLSYIEGLDICGLDSLVRPGSEINRAKLGELGCCFYHGDVRSRSDFELIPKVDWVIDAAANPSVLAGISGSVSSRQVLEHNLIGTVNVLEFCRIHGAGLILLSTSRVYSIMELAGLPLEEKETRFAFPDKVTSYPGVSGHGVTERFSTAPPISLYGATKLSSEILALEYCHAFDFPVWINRCGVVAGPGQFGTAEQGIFSYWIHSWHSGRPLRYIGFDGSGRQVRDALHPADLGRLVADQLQATGRSEKNRIWNIGGGPENSMSLSELSAWCGQRFGHRDIERDFKARPYDLPWVIIDSGAARDRWKWQPAVKIESILEEIAGQAETSPEWLKLSGG
jgi:CDP-paratose 2-epimerase